MISDGYFVDSEVKRISKTVENTFSKSLHGNVKFDFGQVTHPSFGTAHIKGEFPRLLPRKARNQVTEDEVKYLKTKLGKWVESIFDTTKQPKYFDELGQSVSIMSAWADPLHEIESPEMELVQRMYFWLWHTDDVLELAIAKGIPFDALQNGLDQILAVLENSQDPFVEVPGVPGFRLLFDALVDIRKSYELHGSTFVGISPNFGYHLRNYFAALRWFSVRQIDGAYSEETFVCWRRQVAFFEGIGEVIFMLGNKRLPERILRSPSFRRLLDIANSNGAFINDLLGIRKELALGQPDNWIVFKVIQKNIPMEKAIEDACEFLRKELEDFIILRDSVLEEFDYDEGLVAFLDVMESVVDGHNEIYNFSPRHYSVGNVKLTR